MTTAVAKRSAASTAMVEAGAKGRALMGGTRAMRAAGETYLPRFPSESPESYTARLRASWLFNGYRKTVQDMTGRVMNKPVELGDDAPERLREWCQNVDLQGRDLSGFAADLFSEALAGPGIGYVMVDAPRREGTVTQAQAQVLGLRPYLIHLRQEDVLGWKTATVNNVTVLAQIRILESVPVEDPKDPFAEVMIPQVRVIDRNPGGAVTRIFRKVADATVETWAEVPELQTISGLPEITVVPFYANRAGFFAGAPLLEDLADVNIAHWQSQSDQRNILHFARVPILFASGRREDEAALVISAGMAVTSENPEARLVWVEHGGQAIGAGRQDLKDLEFQMEAHGLQLLVARPGGQSATGEALDAAKETSLLAMTADGLKDCLEQSMIWMGAYGGLGDIAPTVVVNQEFGVTMMGAQEMTAMLQAVNTGNLSRETFLRELARRGLLAADINPADEAERIADEGGGMTEPPPVTDGAQ